MSEMKTAALILGLTGCWSASQPTPTPSPDAELNLASVSLGDDCPDATTGEPVDLAPAHGSCAAPGPCNFGQSRCEQTMLQLTVSSQTATKLQIKKIELLDQTGKLLGTLAARKPTQWGSDAYIAWNEQVPANQPLKASYSLSAPDWSALPGGRDPSVTYKVRVTFAVGDHDRVIEKEASVLANIEAPVVT
jgi:hypothetical protein